MHVNMHDLLPAMFAAVDDQAVALFVNALVASNFFRNSQHPAQAGLVFGGDIIYRGDVSIGDYQHMRGQAWIDIAECGNQIILIEHFGGYFLANDLAENSFFQLFIFSHR